MDLAISCANTARMPRLLQNYINGNIQTFPKSFVEIIDTVRLFSVKTLQYLLLTAIGLT